MNSQLLETQDRLNFEESMQRTEDFLQSQAALLRQDPFGKSSDDSESEGEDDSSSFTHSMRTVSSFTHKPSVHES